MTACALCLFLWRLPSYFRPVTSPLGTCVSSTVKWRVWIKWKKESEVAQLCPSLWDSMDCSPPASSIHGIAQAITLEWIATPISRGSSLPRDQTDISYLSCIAGRFFTFSATWEALKQRWVSFFGEIYHYHIRLQPYRLQSDYIRLHIRFQHLSFWLKKSIIMYVLWEELVICTQPNSTLPLLDGRLG